MNTHFFFAHVVLAIDARVTAKPAATANLLIEINDRALVSGCHERHVKVSAQTFKKWNWLGRLAEPPPLTT